MSPVKGMGLIDRLLPVWILAAMAVGVSIGKLEPGLKEDLESIRLADVSLPVGLGLIWMMYPILAKVRYGSMAGFAAQPRLIGTSLILNWVVGPWLMFGLAWAFLPD